MQLKVRDRGGGIRIKSCAWEQAHTLLWVGISVFSRAIISVQPRLPDSDDTLKISVAL